MSDTSPAPHWLITGGVGFIGYHLTRALVGRGGTATIVDDFSDAPYPEVEKRRNERDLLVEYGDRVEVVTADISDRLALAGAFARAASRGPLAGVIHLAGLAGVRPSFKDPARYARVNVEGTANVFELAREGQVSRLVFASSSSVYGNSTPLPAEEDAPAIVPESPYAASKRGAELIVSSLSRRAPEMACVALRFFTVYGPRQRPEMAITLFTRALLRGDAIVMFGDGSMRRDFTHVDDIVRGIVAATDGARPGFRPYNLGSGAPVRLDELVRGIERATGKTAVLKQEAVPLGDVDATFASIARARAELGWSPSVKLEDGLRTVAEWVRAHP